LRRLAGAQDGDGISRQTLQRHALVHEVWLNLAGNEDRKWKRRTIFAAAAEAMRLILVDNARRKRAVRHGGGKQRVKCRRLRRRVRNRRPTAGGERGLEKFAARGTNKSRDWSSSAISSA